MPFDLPELHPKDRHSWAYSQPHNAQHPFVELASYKPGDLPDENTATKIAEDLKAYGIQSSVLPHANGGYKVRIEGAANISKFDSRLPEQEWAANVIHEAYDHAGWQPVAVGVALLARHGRAPEAERMEIIHAAMDTLGIKYGEPQTGRIGPYYPIIDSASITAIQDIDKQAHKVRGGR